MFTPPPPPRLPVPAGTHQPTLHSPSLPLPAPCPRLLQPLPSDVAAGTKEWNRSFVKRWRLVKKRAYLQALGMRALWRVNSPSDRHEPLELLTNDLPHVSARPPPRPLPWLLPPRLPACLDVAAAQPRRPSRRPVVAPAPCLGCCPPVGAPNPAALGGRLAPDAWPPVPRGPSPSKPTPPPLPMCSATTACAARGRSHAWLHTAAPRLPPCPPLGCAAQRRRLSCTRTLRWRPCCWGR